MPARELKTVVLKIVFSLVFVSSSSDHCYKRKGFFVLFCFVWLTWSVNVPRANMWECSLHH